MSLPNLLAKLSKLIEGNPTYIIEGKLNKNLLAADARKYDKDLLNTLQKDKEIKSHFFSETDGGIVFKKDVFLQFINNKEFLPDSFTKYKIKIGLGNVSGSLLSENGDVVLNWPYKDAILEGGQDKEDQKRSEVFFNEVLAPDQITRILDDKVFTNWKRYDESGEHPLNVLKGDDNLIIKGNNLVVLYSLKKKFAGRIKLIYIDPPYNTGNDSFGYNDSFNHSTWLTFMKNRLEVAKSLLSRDGVVIVQCSFHQQAYLNVLMDEIFSRKSHKLTFNVLVRHPERILTGDKEFNDVIEYALVYSKNPDYKMPKILKEKSDDEYTYVVNELSSGKEVDFDGRKAVIFTPDQYEIVKTDKGTLKTHSIRGSLREKNSSGRFYVKYLEPISKDFPAETIFKVDDIGDDGMGYRYFQTPRGNNKNGVYFQGKPQSSNVTEKPYSNYLDFMKEYNVVNSEGGTSFRNGKKPEDLIKFFIEVFTNSESDIILDYHLGSGTTAAVAHKIGRKYIGIEQLYYGDSDPTIRLKNVIDGDQTGISKLVDWQGGGSFVYADIMNNANTFRDRIEKAKSNTDYLNLLNEAASSSFLSYRVDPSKLNEMEFRKLSTAEKRQVLLELIDNNTLYVNHEDINDPIFKVTNSDKKFNEELYKKTDD
jgi:adenine-specific DNA-methyltransferase